MLNLQLTQAKDLDWIIALEQDPANREFICPYSRERHLFSIDDSDELHLKVLTADRQALGFILLAGLNTFNKVIELRRIVIVDKEKGIGTRAMARIIEYCFKELKAQKLWLNVFSFNARAQHVYKKLGFIFEGAQNDSHSNNDKEAELLFYAMLKDQYLYQKKETNVHSKT